MKVQRVVAVAIVAALALSTAACGRSDAEAQAGTIGLAVANLQADFFNQIKQSVEAEAEKRGVEVIVSDAARRRRHPGQPDPGLHHPCRSTPSSTSRPAPRRPACPVKDAPSARASRSSRSTATRRTRRATRSSPPTASPRPRARRARGRADRRQGPAGHPPGPDRHDAGDRPPQGLRAGARGRTRPQGRRHSSPPTGIRTRRSPSPRTCSRPTPTSTSSAARPTRWRSAPRRPPRSPTSTTSV